MQLEVVWRCHCGFVRETVGGSCTNWLDGVGFIAKRPRDPTLPTPSLAGFASNTEEAAAAVQDQVVNSKVSTS